jgi:hypothetical protein
VEEQSKAVLNAASVIDDKISTEVVSVRKQTSITYQSHINTLKGIYVLCLWRKEDIMPYKDPIDREANRRLKYRVQRDRLYREIRIRALNPRDDTSPLICDHCGKVTGRSSAHVFRHYRWCKHYSRTMRVLGYPRTKWSRRPRTSYGVKGDLSNA